MTEIILVATAGSASANSLASVEYADAYLDLRLHASAWVGTETKKRALIEATRDLSAKQWKGRRSTEEQALAWPRQWVPDPDSPTHNYYTSTEVPQRVKDACCELALEYLKAGASDISSLPTNLNVKRKVTGPLETEYFEPRLHPKGLARYPRVMDLIRPLLTSSGMMVPMVRG